LFQGGGRGNVKEVSLLEGRIKKNSPSMGNVLPAPKFQAPTKNRGEPSNSKRCRPHYMGTEKGERYSDQAKCPWCFVSFSGEKRLTWPLKARSYSTVDSVSHAFTPPSGGADVLYWFDFLLDHLVRIRLILARRPGGDLGD